MRIGVLAKDKPERIYVAVKANVALNIGDFCSFALDGTDDGLAVIAGAGTAVTAAGVVGSNIPAGGFGVAQVYGICEATNVVRSTRAATTNSFASGASISNGETLGPNAWAVGSLAAFTGAASNSTDTRTAVVTPIKSFLRIL